MVSKTREFSNIVETHDEIYKFGASLCLYKHTLATILKDSLNS